MFYIKEFIGQCEIIDKNVLTSLTVMHLALNQCVVFILITFWRYLTPRYTFAVRTIKNNSIWIIKTLKDETKP